VRRREGRSLCALSLSKGAVLSLSKGSARKTIFIIFFMRALICGAGVAGLTLACLLDRAGWDVQLVERARSLRREGFMIDFFGPGFEAAETMGLLPRLRELAYTINELNYVDPSGRPRATLNYRRMVNSLDGRLISLLRGDLAHALYEGLSPRVVQLYGCSVEALHERAGEVTATLTDGTRWSGDLMIGADGIHSTVRELAFGPESSYLRYLGFHTAAYTFADPELRKKLREQFALTDSVDKTVGLYAIRNGRIAVFTAHRSPDPAIPADPRMVVQTTYSDLGWLVPDALAHCPDPPDLYYDQVSQIEMPRWATDRVALIGDACQAVSLLAGQGASLAVAGAQLLAAELANGTDVTDALARYNTRLAVRVADKQAAGRRAAEWFLPSSPRRLLLRRLALRAMALPGLGRPLSSRLVAGAGGIR
jgi:2-polyprenyl-6-methoxyphenol hydroxylase-like FAD-dependent oxidoreductase